MQFFRKNVVHYRATSIVLGAVAFALLACFGSCSPRIVTLCTMYTDDAIESSECQQSYYDYCQNTSPEIAEIAAKYRGGPGTVITAEEAALYNNHMNTCFDEWKLIVNADWQVPSNAPAPNPMQQQSIIAPPQADCSSFRLTSPLDGLPNGVATFYWDPVPGATSYTVGVYGSGATPVSFSAGAGSSSVSGDVSQAAIGGQYEFYIEAQAFLPDGTVCTSGAGVMRAAGSGEPVNNNGSDDDGDDDQPAANNNTPAEEEEEDLNDQLK
jgi:hypothetical protein